MMKISLLYELLATIGFRQSRGRWCEPVSLCVCPRCTVCCPRGVSLEITLPSWSLSTHRVWIRAMSSSKVSLHCRRDTHFFQRRQLFMSSSFHFGGLIENSSDLHRLRRVLSFESVHFQRARPLVLSTSALDTGASYLCVFLFHQSSHDRLLFKGDSSLFCRRFYRHSFFRVGGFVCFMCFSAFSHKCVRRTPLLLLVCVLGWFGCDVFLHGSIWPA